MENGKTYSVYTQTDPAVWKQRGMEALEAGKLDEAIECFSTGLLYAPFDADLYYWRGRKLMGFNQYAHSASDLRLAAQLDPKHWEKWYYGAVAAYLGGLYEVSLESMTKAHEMIIRSGELRHLPAAVDWLWQINMRLGHKEEALAIAKALEADLNEVEDGDYLSRVMLYRGELPVEGFVERCMAEIPEGNKDRPDIYRVMLTYGLANYLRWNGEIDKAIPLLKEVATSDANPHLFAIKQANWDLKELGQN